MDVMKIFVHIIENYKCNRDLLGTSSCPAYAEQEASGERTMWKKG